MKDHIDDKRRFAGLMVGLSDYYKQEISKSVLSVYWEGLKQYDFEAIEKAAGAHMQSPDEAGRWMPKIADFVKLLQGRTVDQASIAWTKVEKAIRIVGPWDDVMFDDGLIHRVIMDMGGWPKMCEVTTDEQPFMAKEFVTRYQGYRMRSEAPEYPRQLIGMANAANGQQGRMQLSARMVGDENKIRMMIVNSTDAPLMIRRAGEAVKALTH